ncbi:MAG: hypothetical protein DI568_03955 [Sphingomonas sp.]|nr:MAG: hypothetical protein DI568_03955 [Sphingomonas sp.]
MRKIIAVLLYLLAIIMLALAPLFGSMAFHDGGTFQTRMALLVYLLLALIPLLLGLLTEPDGRLIPAGLILMGASVGGVLLTLLMSATLGNPALLDRIAPGEELKLSWAGLLPTSLPMALVGAGLWWVGKVRSDPASRTGRYGRVSAVFDEMEDMAE